MREVHSAEAPKPIGPYSQAIKSRGMLFCSGQIALDPKTGQLVTGGIKEQTRQVLQNLREVLKASESDLNKVLKTTVFLADMSDFQDFNEVYNGFFRPPYPARTTVQVARLPRDAKVEIEFVAEL